MRLLLGLFLSFQAPVFAQEIPFDGSGSLPPKKIKLDVGGFHEPVGLINFNKAGLSVPLFYSEDSALFLSAKGSDFTAPDGLLLPDSGGLSVPRLLSSREISLGYSHLLSENRLWGARIAYGSASSDPFIGTDVITTSANVSYSFPAEDPQNRWLLGLFYSNNNPILKDIPFPIFAYAFNGAKVSGVAGVPFVYLRWTPSEDPWTVSFFALGTITRTELAYGPFPFQKFIGFQWYQQTWLRHKRQNEEDKLYFDEKKIFVGTRLPLAKFLFSDWQVGHAFDRSFYEAEGFDKKKTGSATLPASWYAAWDLKLDF